MYRCVYHIAVKRATFQWVVWQESSDTCQLRGESAIKASHSVHAWEKTGHPSHGALYKHILGEENTERMEVMLWEV